MSFSEQWNWVLLAYGFASITLVVFTASIAVRISRARRILGDDA